MPVSFWLHPQLLGLSSRYHIQELPQNFQTFLWPSLFSLFICWTSSLVWLPLKNDWIFVAAWSTWSTSRINAVSGKRYFSLLDRKINWKTHVQCRYVSMNFDILWHYKFKETVIFLLLNDIDFLLLARSFIKDK